MKLIELLCVIFIITLLASMTLVPLMRIGVHLKRDVWAVYRNYDARIERAVNDDFTRP